MAKKNIPKGQINKVTSNLNALQDLIKMFGEQYSIRVGIIGEKAAEKHKGTDLTNADLGAIHEFGGTAEHPGGQPYYINSSTGMAHFVSKNSLFGQYLIEKGQVTKSHTINIPARSFLRETLLTSAGKRKLINTVFKDVQEQLGAEFSTNKTVNKFAYKNEVNNPRFKELMQVIAETTAQVAHEMVVNRFDEDKIKPPTAESSKKIRKGLKGVAGQGNTTGPTLIDTGQLRDSISYEVKRIK